MADLSLHQIEFASSEARAIVSLLADTAAVPEVQSLGGLVAARHFGELALISNSIGSELLPRNMSQGGSPALSHPLHRLSGVLFAEWAVSFKLFWHLHFGSSLNLHFSR
jgi:hypothetical protein